MREFIFSIDSILIAFYRISGNPLVDYFLGTFLLSFLVVLIGEFSLSLAYRWNKKHLDSLHREMEKMKDLSMTALKIGDRKTYRFLNKEANDAYGRAFFSMFTLSAASLWPVFFALAWMQWRFLKVKLSLPLMGVSVGYFTIFALSYILARIFFKNFKRRLPYFKGVLVMLYESIKKQGKGMEGFEGPF